MKTNCTDAERWMLLQASGELTPARSEALARHLKECPACSRTLADWTAFARLLSDDRRRHEPPRPETIALVRAAATEAAGRHRAAARARHWAILAAAASLALLLGAYVTGRFTAPATRALTAASATADDTAWWLATWMGESGIQTLAGGVDGQDRESLAEILLQFQGMAMESHEEWMEPVTSTEERQPTALRWRSTGGSRPGRCG